MFRPVARLFGGRLSPAVARALFASHDAERERAANERAARALAAAGFDPSSLNVVLDALDRLDLNTDEAGVPTWGTTHDRGSSACSRTGSRRPDAARAGEPMTSSTACAACCSATTRASAWCASTSSSCRTLRIALTIPDQWDVSSDRTRMIAASPDQDAFIVLQWVPRSRFRPAANTATALAVRAGFRPGAWRDDDLQRADGDPSVTATGYSGRDGRRCAPGSPACRRRAGQFVVAGVAGTSKYAEFREPVHAAAIQSVRAMSAAEAAGILPDRIELETAEPGDTWDRDRQAARRRRHGQPARHPQPWRG